MLQASKIVSHGTTPAAVIANKIIIINDDYPQRAVKTFIHKETMDRTVQFLIIDHHQ